MDGSTVRIKGLVLGRREGESVHLKTPEETIVVEVVSIQGRQVRIRFSASDAVAIVRSELLDH